MELLLSFSAKELHAESALDLSNPLVLLLKMPQVLVPATGREVRANPADGVVVLSRFLHVHTGSHLNLRAIVKLCHRFSSTCRTRRDGSERYNK